jgi:hypothetical protein
MRDLSRALHVDDIPEIEQSERQRRDAKRACKQTEIKGFAKIGLLVFDVLVIEVHGLMSRLLGHFLSPLMRP